MEQKKLSVEDISNVILDVLKGEGPTQEVVLNWHVAHRVGRYLSPRQMKEALQSLRDHQLIDDCYITGHNGWQLVPPKENVA